MALTKVSSSLVSDNAVTTAKIVDGGIATADIAANAVTSAKIAQNSILTKHIDDGQVTTDQLGADAVTSAKIADDAISEEHLDVTVITSLSEVTAATGDLLMVADISDSNNLKKIPVSSILAGTHTGSVNTTGSVIVDNITIDGSVITAGSANDLTIDAVGDIILDADGADVKLKDGGTLFGSVGNNGTYVYVGSHGNSGKGIKITDALLPADNAGAFNDADVNLGASNVRWKNLYLSGSTTTSNITSGPILINSNSSAFGGSSVQGFNTDFLVDTGQGYSRHNSYHTGGSNHQFIVNATGSTTNTVALAINKDANATFAGGVTATGNYTSGNDASIFTFQRVGGAVAGNIEYNDATTDMEFGTTTAHSFSIKTGNTRRLSIDNSTGGIGIPGKLAVLSSAAHGSYDFYNNGSSYFNGQVIVDDHLSITGSSAQLTVAGNITMTAAADRRIFMGGQAGATFGLAYDSGNPNYGIFYTEASPDVVNISPNGSATDGSLRVLGNGQIEATGGNIYLTGSVDRRIKLSDSGVAGLSDSDNTVHIRANDDDLILSAAGNGTIRFKENGGEHLSINKDGYAKFTSVRSEYAMELNSAGGRAGIVLNKPGTSSIMGSLLMLASDESYRLGTASNYHIRMMQNGDTYFGNSENSHFTSNGGLRLTNANGYNQLRLESNATDNTNKTSGITSLMYTNNTCSIFQGFFQNGSNAVYYGSADGAHRGLQRHYFYVNDNYNATSNHKLVMTLASSTSTALVVNGNNSTGGTVNWIADSNKGSTESHCHYGSNGDWYIRPANVASGDVNVRNYAAESDERLKTNIVDITYGTTELLQLRPRKFEWKEGAGERNGFIAQEVESVIPAFVKTGELKIEGREEEDGIKTVDYNSIVATLVKTVQELEARIKTLEG